MKTNEIAITEAIQETEILVQETDRYSIFKQPDGKFVKRMKYEKFWSKVPETEEEMLEMFQIMNEENHPKVVPMKNATGDMFDIVNVYFNPYEKFDEETGQSISGITTTIEASDGKYYATSSKTVYYNLQNMFEAFGEPNTPKYLGIKVAVVSTKAKNGQQISLKLLGLATKK